MSTRKVITQKGGKVTWCILVQTPLMNGYYFGTAKNIAEAEDKINRFLDSIDQKP